MKKQVVAIAVILALTLIGCPAPEPPGGEEPSEPPAGDVGSLVLHLSGSQIPTRTVAPAVEMEIAYYNIGGNGPGSFTETNVVGDTFTKVDLPVGVWTILVDAYNSGDQKIGHGERTVSIAVGPPTAATVDVLPLDGTGTLSITITWPEAMVGSPSISATLTAVGGDAETLDFTVGAGSAGYTSGVLDDGCYSLVIQLLDDGVVKWGLFEAVRILADQTTTVIDGPSVSTGGLDLTINPEMQNPITVTVTGASEIEVGTDATFSATTSEAVDSYHWYLNGGLLSGETSASITIGSALAEGAYRLDLAVSKGSILSSGTLEIAVASPAGGYQSGAIASVSVGEDYTMILKIDGTLWATGWNYFGQLGDSSHADRSIPVQVMTDVASVSAGWTHTMILKTDGTLWATGDNTHGQLGDGTTTWKPTPVQVM